MLSELPEAQRMSVFRSPVKLSTQLQHEIYQSLQTIRLELIPPITQVMLRSANRLLSYVPSLDL